MKPTCSWPTQSELAHNSVLRHGPNGKVGRIVRCRRRLNYFTAEEFYELTVARLVQSRTRWLDIGCGRDLLPMNRPLAKTLSKRCRRVVGVDPSENVLQNDLVHERVRTRIEQFRSNEPFDLVTLRMVVEHIQNPGSCVEAIRQNTRPGAIIVVYTPHKYSISSMVAALTPNYGHHAFKSRLWRTEERDTFPTVYRMNTICSLRSAFCPDDFALQSAWHVHDAAIFHSCSRLGRLELYTWSLLQRLRVGYPESNILAIFERTGKSTV